MPEREDGAAAEDGLEPLRTAIAACRLCRDNPAGGVERRLPHEPRPVAVISRRAPILIAGQAPGLRVHESGIPFNDASGDRLRSWLGVSREEFYDPDLFAIVPMGFCFPGYDAKGSDLPPRRECAARWRAEVIASMPQVQLLLAVGSYAQRWHLGHLAARGMTGTVENWEAYLSPEAGPPVIAMPHPSWRNSGWLKRNSWFETNLLPALKHRVRALIG